MVHFSLFRPLLAHSSSTYSDFWSENKIPDYTSKRDKDCVCTVNRTTLSTPVSTWVSDSSLSIDTHINTLLSKVRSRIRFLYCNKATFTHSAKHTLIKMTILPILDYGPVICQFPKIFSINWMSSTITVTVMVDDELIPVTDPLISVHLWNQYWKTSSYLRSLLDIHSSNRNSHSSSCIDLFIPKVFTSFGRLSFQFAASGDWNQLHKTVKLSTLLLFSSFKNSLQTTVCNPCTCFWLLYWDQRCHTYYMIYNPNPRSSLLMRTGS